MMQDDKQQDTFNFTEQAEENIVGEGNKQAGENTPQTVEEQLASKDAEISNMQDRLLRMAAETENIRKRLEREKAESISYGNEALIRDLLSVVDNLERAVQHGLSEQGTEGLLNGVQMTLKGFLDLLAKYGCKPFESEGKAFDPNYHEAMMQEESQDYPENTIIKEFQKGYMLHDRLLRPAMVIVAKPPQKG